VIKFAKVAVVVAAGTIGAGIGEAAANPPDPAAASVSSSEASKTKDPCLRVRDTETITVCAPRLTPLELRLVERRQDPLKDNPWAILRMMELGDSGTHSCSNVGRSGMSGCEVRSLRRADREGRDASVFGDIKIDLRRRP